MSSIESFFVDHLIPVSQRLRERGASLLDTKHGEQRSSWQPAPTTPDFLEFGAEHRAAALTTQWDQQSYPELTSLVDPLLALADEIEVTADESGEVSPFVYVMY